MDEDILQHKVGSANGQQAFEALAILVMLRTWAPRWKGRRVKLAVKSDSVSALTVLLKFKTIGEAPGVIAREIALDVAGSVYTPTLVRHIPGVANTVADVLSRWFAPGGPPQLPPILAEAQLRICPPRGREWWKTLRP